MTIHRAIRGALTTGLPPGLAMSLAAAQWGAMPGEVLVLGLVLGAVAGKWFSKLLPARPVKMLRLPASTQQPERRPSFYSPTHCVFGKRQGVEL